MEDEEPQRSSMSDAPKTSWGEDPPTWVVLMSLVLSPIGLFLWYVGGIGYLLAFYWILTLYEFFAFPPFFLDWLFSDWVIGQFDRFELQTTPEGVNLYQENHPGNPWSGGPLQVLTSTVIGSIGTFILLPVWLKVKILFPSVNLEGS